MIQRIQTLYLLAALGLVLCSFFLPIADLNGQDGTVFSLSLQGFNNPFSGNISGFSFRASQIVSVLLFVSLIITVLLYRKRLVQLKLCYLNIFLSVFLEALFIFLLIYSKNAQNFIVSYKVTVIFPLFIAVMVYLANRSIKKDEDLVRSLDRLR